MKNQSISQGASKVRKFVLLLIIAIGIPACASTQSPSSAASGSSDTDAVEETTAKTEKKRCRRDASTGSRLGSKRICD
jgi:hypothetical protein